MSEVAAQLGLTLRPSRPPRADEQVRVALALLLQARHSGRARAATWQHLRDELVAEGLPMMLPRRLQEAAEDLLDQKHPVVGLSSAGVFYAETADEIEEALRETERRARKTLTRRKRLRRVWMEMRGQEAIRAVEESTHFTTEVTAR